MIDQLDRISQFLFEQSLAKTGEMAIMYFILHATLFAFYGAFAYTIYRTIRLYA